MEEEWDYLIVLDACRYDYFEQLCHQYLEGDLAKKISVGSATKEWRTKSFTKSHSDVIYISANPYFTSRTVVKGFSGKDHFHKIYDLWYEYWDDENSTVLPETVTEKSIEIINSLPEKRAIIHYIQPHEPYLGESVLGLRSETPIRCGIAEIAEEGFVGKLFSQLMVVVSGIFYWIGLRGNFLIWKAMELLRMSPASPMDIVRRKLGKEGLREAYRENLHIVLKQVAGLVKHLSGRIVITADHGEMLGEYYCYSHWSRSSLKHLIEIPWFVIDKGRKRTTAPDISQSDTGTQEDPAKSDVEEASDKEIEEQVRAKLKSLGYM